MRKDVIPVEDAQGGPRSPRRFLRLLALLLAAFALLSAVWYFTAYRPYDVYMEALRAQPGWREDLGFPECGVDGEGYTCNVARPGFLHWTGNLGIGLPALTLEKGAQKQSIYRAARLLVWAAYILLLNWRAGAMRLDADDCWLISVLGVPVAGAVYELLEQKGQVTAKWYHAPLALLALLTVSMAALQDMRFILLLVGLGVLWWICARLGTLAGKYKVVMQGFWGAAAMLLLAASRQLGTREAIPANWLLGVSWCVLTVFLSVRYRAANAMEIYPEEYSTVYRLCNVVPLLAAVLAALCVVF